MNRLLWMLVALLSLAACTEDTEYTAGVWYRRSDFDGVARMDAAGFTIGNKGYLCGGYRGSKKERLKDLWEYHIDNDWWTQCEDMPDEAIARNAATGFAVGTKGYIVGGYDKDANDYLDDCWEYDGKLETDGPLRGRCPYVCTGIWYRKLWLCRYGV